MVIRSLAAVSLALVNVLLLVLIILVLSLLPTATQLGGGLQGLTSTPDRLAHALGTRSAELLQEVSDLLDPTHPPRQPLAQDVEFSAWNRVAVGDVVAASGTHQLTLGEVRRRADAASGDHAAYAIVRQRLETPRVTRIFDIPIRVDTGEMSYILYKGESFQVGEAFYKVNWVSPDPGEIAIAQYRRRQDVPTTLKFALP
jgi:hypothetical protein